MLRTYFEQTFYDMPVEIAQKYAEGIRVAILTGKDFDGEKKKGFFLSKKRGFDDKLYVGNIHRIEDHLYWNDEELADDDQIVNVVVIDGPVTRDGDGCSYGSKDHRDQITYANTIPQVVGHIFILNTPGGAASARIDYEQAIAECREKGKPTVAWVDGMCCSAGQLVASLCDRTVVMNGRDTMGCIGTMCAFWAVANGTVDKDGYRYIELVSVTSPDKNAEYREAADGKTEKLQAELDKLGEEFRETVRQNRPLVKEEHLTGKTFDAQDVMGALVDEIGDYNRAIECVFELADKKIEPARSLSPDPSPKGEGSDDPEEQPEEIEIVKPKNDNDMKEETKNTETTEKTETTEVQETQATGQEGTAPSNSPEGGEQEAEAAPSNSPEGGEQEQPSEEAVADAQAEIDRITETLHNAEAMVEEKDKTIAALQGDMEVLKKEAGEKDATIVTLEGIAKERDEKAKELATALKNLEEKDITIAGMQENLDKLTAELDAKKKALAEKEAEIKELAGKPTPMTNAASGVPADNGTGEGPKVNKHQRIKPGMSYKEIRASQKEK